MKNFIIFFIILSAFSFSVSAQDTATKGHLTVWAEQGWIIKARNTGNDYIIFKFKWTTVGTNSAGEVVSTLVEESKRITLSPDETRHFFTAPQDPNKQITYVFKDIIISEYDSMTKQEMIIEAKKGSGR